MKNEFETIEKRNERILLRFSVFDLREQSEEDLEIADGNLIKGLTSISVTSHGETPNLIRWFVVRSGENIYEVRRFYNFCFCSCEGFFYSGKCCKHIAATTASICALCKKEMPLQSKNLCLSCEIMSAPMLKKTTDKKPERIGNVRI